MQEEDRVNGTSTADEEEDVIIEDLSENIEEDLNKLPRGSSVAGNRSGTGFEQDISDTGDNRGSKLPDFGKRYRFKMNEEEAFGENEDEFGVPEVEEEEEEDSPPIDFNEFLLAQSLVNHNPLETRSGKSHMNKLKSPINSPLKSPLILSRSTKRAAPGSPLINSMSGSHVISGLQNISTHSTLNSTVLSQQSDSNKSTPTRHHSSASRTSSGASTYAHPSTLSPSPGR